MGVSELGGGAGRGKMLARQVCGLRGGGVPPPQTPTTSKSEMKSRGGEASGDPTFGQLVFIGALSGERFVFFQ
jgi:hypothetical protein